MTQFDVHRNIGMHSLEIVSVATEQLGEKVTSLAQEGDRITGAMDELLTHAWA